MKVLGLMVLVGVVWAAAQVVPVGVESSLTRCPKEIQHLVLGKLGPEDLLQVLATSTANRQATLQYLCTRMYILSTLVQEGHSYKFYLEVHSPQNLFIFQKSLVFSRILAPFLEKTSLRWVSRECPLYYWLVWTAISYKSGKIIHAMRSLPALWNLNQDKVPFSHLLVGVLGSIRKGESMEWERFKDFLSIVARSGNKFDPLIIKTLYRTGHVSLLKRFMAQGEASEIMFYSRNPTVLSPYLDVLVKEVIKRKDLAGFKFVLNRALRRLVKDWIPLCLLCIRRDFPDALMENMHLLIHPMTKKEKSILLRAACRWLTGNYSLISLLLRSGANPNEFMDLDTFVGQNEKHISKWVWLSEKMGLEHDLLGLNCRDILNQRQPIDLEIYILLYEYSAAPSLYPLDGPNKGKECVVKKFYKKAMKKSKPERTQFYCSSIKSIHRLVQVNGELVALMPRIPRVVDPIDVIPSDVVRVLRIGDTVAGQYTLLALSHFHTALSHDSLESSTLIRLDTVLSFYSI